MNNHITFSLVNGLKIVHIKKPDSNIISVALSGCVGALAEHSSEIGCAHFIEHLVLKKSKKYPEEKIFSDFIKSTGGHSNGATNFNTVYYPVSHAKEYVEDVFDFISQVFLHPLFDIETFEREKKVIIEESKRAQSDVDRVMFNQAYKGVSETTRLNTLILGEPKDIEKLSLEMVLAFHKKWYIPENFILVIVSGESHEKIKELSEKYFESKIANNKLLFSKKENIKMLFPETILDKVISFPHLKTDKFMYIYAIEPVSDIEEDAMSIAGGEVIRKRLHDVLRTEKGLTYGVGVNFVSYNKMGLFVVTFASALENRDAVQAVFQQVVDSFVVNSISEAEFERGKSQSKVQLEFLSERSASIAERVANMSMKKNQLYTLEDDMKILTSTSKDSVESVIKKILSAQPVKILATNGEVRK